MDDQQTATPVSKEFKKEALKTGAIILLIFALAVLGFFISASAAKLSYYTGRSTLDVIKASFTQGKANSNTSTSTPQALKIEIKENEHIKGNSDAKIALIEYSDFDCPYCFSFHSTIKGVVEASNGQIKWIYRHFPLASLHPEATKKAEAAECVTELGGNDAFWEFADTLFTKQTTTGGLPKLADVTGIVTSMGLDKAAFDTCLSSGRYTDAVTANFNLGAAQGVNGTPGTIVLNVETGKYTLVSGAVEQSKLQAAIDFVK